LSRARAKLLAFHPRAHRDKVITPDELRNAYSGFFFESYLHALAQRFDIYWAESLRVAIDLADFFKDFKGAILCPFSTDDLDTFAFVNWCAKRDWAIIAFDICDSNPCLEFRSDVSDLIEAVGKLACWVHAGHRSIDRLCWLAKTRTEHIWFPLYQPQLPPARPEFERAWLMHTALPVQHVEVGRVLMVTEKTDTWAAMLVDQELDHPRLKYYPKMSWDEHIGAIRSCFALFHFAPGDYRLGRSAVFAALSGKPFFSDSEYCAASRTMFPQLADVHTPEELEQALNRINEALETAKEFVEREILDARSIERRLCELCASIFEIDL